MLKREYRWKGLNVIEIHYLDKVTEFMNNHNFKNIDVIKFYQVKENYNNVLDEFHTLHIDLKDDEDDIFNNIHKRIRQYIRKTERESDINFKIIKNCTISDINEFFKEFELFNKQKGFAVNIEFHKQSALKFKENIFISKAISNDDILVSYLTYFEQNRARQKLVFTKRLDDKYNSNYIARANRSLIWNDIKYSKDLGLLIYDMGGITINTKDKDKNAITEAKYKITKNQIIEYQGNIGISLKGKSALLLHKTLQKIKN